MAQEKYLGENGLKRLVGLVKEDLGTKANIDGSYDGLQVGSAKQIVSPTGITDTTPYVFRTTCGETSISGGDEQLASLKAIRGNTIAWNQLTENGNFVDSSGWSSENITRSVAANKMTGTCNGDNKLYLDIYRKCQFIKDHKYLIKATIKTSVATTSVRFTLMNSSYKECGYKEEQVNFLTKLTHSIIVSCSETDTNGFVFYKVYGTFNTGDTVEYENCQLFDLTQMFGPGNEPTSVLEFTRLFPKTYYPFNAGEIRNVKIKGLKTTGYNQLSLDRTVGTLNGAAFSNGNAQDFEENKYYAGLASNDYVRQDSVTNVSISGNAISFTTISFAYGLGLPIRVIAGQTYTLEKTGTNAGECRIAWYGQNGLFISSVVADNNVSMTAPDNAYWGVIVLRANADGATATFSNICFHLAWSGSRTGHGPHEEHVLHIDTSRYFPDGMNGIDGVYDELTPKHAFKRFTKVDLGTREWLRYETDGVYRFGTTLPDMKVPTTYAERAKGCRMAKYSASSNWSYATMDDKSWLRIGNGFFIRDDSYVDETAFKQAMSGVYLIIPLAEPVVTEIPQVRDNHWEIKVDDYGTEEWLFPEGDEIPVPVGHETLYMDNLVDKLRNLPDPNDYKALESEVQTWVKLPPLPTDTSKVYVPKFVNGTIKWVEE